jgi:hypothetical protein
VLVCKISDELLVLAYNEDQQKTEGLVKEISNFLEATKEGIDRSESFLQMVIGMAALKMRHWTRCAFDKTMGLTAGTRSRCRPDVVLSSASKKSGLVVELKWSDKQDARYALWQIADTHYVTRAPSLQEEEIRRVVALGIQVLENPDDAGKDQVIFLIIRPIHVHKGFHQFFVRPIIQGAILIMKMNAVQVWSRDPDPVWSLVCFNRPWNSFINRFYSYIRWLNLSTDNSLNIGGFECKL